MTLLNALARLLIRGLPSDLRRRHGPAMLATFEEGFDVERRTRGRVRGHLWAVRHLVDLAGVAGRHGWRVAILGTLDDVRNATRALWRRPSGALFAVATVGLGVGASTIIFSAFDAVLLRPLPVPDADRVVFLWRGLGGGSFYPAGEDDVELWAQETALFEDLLHFGAREVAVGGEQGVARQRAGLVSPGYGAFMSVDPILGRGFLEEDSRQDAAAAVILSEGLWRTRFGASPSALGQSLRIDGVSRTVVGVFPARLVLPRLARTAPDLWLPLADGTRRPAVVTRLRPGVTVEAAQARLDALAEGVSAERGSNVAYAVRTVADMTSSSLQDSLRLLMAAVSLLLAIACVNVMVLLLHRGAERRKETAVRMAIGASGVRVARQHLLESGWIGAVGCGIGVGLAVGGAAAARALAPPSHAWLSQLTLDWRAIGFAVCIALVSTFVFGFMPALQAVFGSPDILVSSGTDGRVTRRGRRARSAMIVAEVALSFALLVGAGSVLSALVAMQRVHPGFNADGLTSIVVNLPTWKHESAQEQGAVMDEVAEALGRIPGHRVARATGSPPESGIYFGSLEIESRGIVQESAAFHGNAIGADYFAVLQQRIVEGRGLTADEVRDRAPLWVIGESAARTYFPEGDAVGSRARLGPGPWQTIVGVAEDAMHNGLAGEKGSPQLYDPIPDVANAFIVRGPGVESSIDLRALVLEVEPEALVDVTPVPRLLERSLARERLLLALLGCFGTCALLLSGVGLYGVVSRIVSGRRREIGIRVALGAVSRQLIGGVVGRSGGTAVTGVLLGIVLTGMGFRLLDSTLPGLQQGSWTAYAGAGALMIAVALFASWIPARRVARVDPAQVLNAE